MNGPFRPETVVARDTQALRPGLWERALQAQIFGKTIKAQLYDLDLVLAHSVLYPHW
jgi:hypothetical protein